MTKDESQAAKLLAVIVFGSMIGATVLRIVLWVV